jgi:hypothetical protein
MSQNTKREKKVNVSLPTAETAAMKNEVPKGGEEADRLNLDPREFEHVLAELARGYKDLVALARKIGTSEGFELQNGEKLGARELNALVSEQSKKLKSLKKNYTAHGKKKKRVQTGNQGKGKGFAKGSFLRPEFEQFLMNANFGNDADGRALRETLAPLLKDHILSRGILTPLLTIYMIVNGLRYKDDNGKVKYRVGPEMEKYLGAYFDDLEKKDRALSDEDMRDKNGRPKPRFDRNGFVYNRIQSIVSHGVIPSEDLTDDHRAYLASPEVEGKLERAQAVVSAALARANPKVVKPAGEGRGRGRKAGTTASTKKTTTSTGVTTKRTRSRSSERK